jgi:hypothetical protein
MNFARGVSVKICQGQFLQLNYFRAVTKVRLNVFFMQQKPLQMCLML